MESCCVNHATSLASRPRGEVPLSTVFCRCNLPNSLQYPDDKQHGCVRVLGSEPLPNS